ncbi:hypothetical protein EV702DRAFT_1279515 [Suillus placidus]|uniref:Spp2/MOS2 G-patch domain-containing protein n=1 Tax=Suillus placidus TaxID=48579 RepID=A0A9P7D1H0_9AGAM|nr:hypothetical protein EV702DRAFT_1279515 [Suillus placidus]
MSKLSFTVRKPPAADNERASDKFKLPVLPRHLSSAASSASGTPLTGSPRTFSSREDPDDEEESGIVFADGGRKDGPDSSDDEDGRLEDELITSFNKFGAQRSQKAHVLLSSSSPNPDWREAARRRRAGIARFIPDSAKASTGADGSVGGLGTRDTINSGPQLSGVQFGNKEVKVDTTTTSTDRETNMTIEEHVNAIVEETEDQKALRALLAGDMDSVPQTDSIPVPPTETDALQQDAADLPDIDDYARVPITAAKKNALVEPYLLKSRPALLGIEAKEQEVLDDGSKKKKQRGDEKRYVPLVRQESSREESRNESAIVSRRASRSPERRSGGESRRRDDDRDKPRRESDRDRRRERDRDDRGDRDRDDRRRRDDSRRDSDRDLDRRNRDRDVDKRRDRVRDYDDRDRRRDGESKRGGRDRRD